MTSLGVLANVTVDTALMLDQPTHRSETIGNKTPRTRNQQSCSSYRMVVKSTIKSLLPNAGLERILSDPILTHKSRHGLIRVFLHFGKCEPPDYLKALRVKDKQEVGNNGS